MDWLLRPVIRGYCRFESLKDGSITLEDIAVLNDAADLFDENQRRAEEALRNG
jgi:hypothetical protein